MPKAVTAKAKRQAIAKAYGCHPAEYYPVDSITPAANSITDRISSSSTRDPTV